MNFYSVKGQNDDQRKEMTDLLDRQEGVSYQQFDTAQDLYVATTINTAADAYGVQPTEEITNRALDTFGVMDQTFAASVNNFFEEISQRVNQG